MCLSLPLETTRGCLTSAGLILHRQNDIVICDVKGHLDTLFPVLTITNNRSPEQLTFVFALIYIIHHSPNISYAQLVSCL